MAVRMSARRAQSWSVGNFELTPTPRLNAVVHRFKSAAPPSCTHTCVSNLHSSRKSSNSSSSSTASSCGKAGVCDSCGAVKGVALADAAAADEDAIRWRGAISLGNDEEITGADRRQLLLQYEERQSDACNLWRCNICVQHDSTQRDASVVVDCSPQRLTPACPMDEDGSSSDSGSSPRAGRRNSKCGEAGGVAEVDESEALHTITQSSQRDRWHRGRGALSAYRGGAVMMTPSARRSSLQQQRAGTDRRSQSARRQLSPGHLFGGDNNGAGILPDVPDATAERILDMDTDESLSHGGAANRHAGVETASDGDDDDSGNHGGSHADSGAAGSSGGSADHHSPSALAVEASRLSAWAEQLARREELLDAREGAVSMAEAKQRFALLLRDQVEERERAADAREAQLRAAAAAFESDLRAAAATERARLVTLVGEADALTTRLFGEVSARVEAAEELEARSSAARDALAAEFARQLEALSAREAQLAAAAAEAHAIAERGVAAREAAVAAAEAHVRAEAARAADALSARDAQLRADHARQLEALAAMEAAVAEKLVALREAHVGGGGSGAAAASGGGSRRGGIANEFGFSGGDGLGARSKATAVSSPASGLNSSHAHHGLTTSGTQAATWTPEYDRQTGVVVAPASSSTARVAPLREATPSADVQVMHPVATVGAEAQSPYPLTAPLASMSLEPSPQGSMLPVAASSSGPSPQASMTRDTRSVTPSAFGSSPTTVADWRAYYTSLGFGGGRHTASHTPPRSAAVAVMPHYSAGRIDIGIGVQPPSSSPSLSSPFLLSAQAEVSMRLAAAERQPREQPAYYTASGVPIYAPPAAATPPRAEYAGAVAMLRSMS